MRWWNCLSVVLVAMLVPVSSTHATEVVFEFGSAIERRLVRLEASELRRETHFRDRWSVAASHSPQIWYAFSSSSERMIPDLREYSLRTLAERMIRHNLEVIGQANTDNVLIVKVNDFYGAHRLPSFQGPNALIKGEVTLMGPNGDVIFREKRTVRTRKRYERVNYYEGRGHPYPSGDFIGRFGGMFSVYLFEMMSDVYQSSDVPAPIVLRRTVMTLDKRENETKFRKRKMETALQSPPEVSGHMHNMMPAFEFDSNLFRN